MSGFQANKNNMKNPELINSIQQNSRYKNIAVPFNPEISKRHIKDAEFLLRDDGIIFNIEGYNHPTDFLVGEVLYAPDDNGDKNIFGQPYRKVTLYKDTYEPVPYSDRARILRQFDQSFDQTGTNPFFAKFKQILPASDFIAYLPSSRGLQRALALQTGDNEKFHRDFENLMYLLGITLEQISLGLTGAPLLVNTEHFHDLDIVFSGSLE